jgi:hypothetical protein
MEKKNVKGIKSMAKNRLKKETADKIYKPYKD